MENIQCVNCNKTLVSVVMFCPFCLVQLKCKRCKAFLIKDAIGCTECGTSIISKEGFGNAVNQIEFEQKGDSKKFKATFSDEVGHTLVETFGISVVGSGIQLKKRTNPFIANKIENVNPTNITKNSVSQIQDIDIEENDISEELSKIFKQQDEDLILINPRLKQISKLDNAIRLAILSLYAYEKIGKPAIERKVLSIILKASKLNISVFSTWINRCDEIIKDGNKIQLSVPGKSVAIEILKEIADSTIVKGQVKFSKTGSTGSKRNKNIKSGPEESEDTSLPKKVRASSQAYSIVTTLNLNPNNKQNFKDFFTPYTSKNHSEHILIIVYYLQKIISENNINVNSIYTCYKQTSIKVPNIIQALSNIKIRNGWIDTADWNNLKVSIAGENYLEHDLKKRD